MAKKDAELVDREVPVCVCGISHFMDGPCPSRMAIALVSPSLFAIKDLNDADILILRSLADKFAEKHLEIVENWIIQEIEERRSHEN